MGHTNRIPMPSWRQPGSVAAGFRDAVRTTHIDLGEDALKQSDSPETPLFALRVAGPGSAPAATGYRSKGWAVAAVAVTVALVLTGLALILRRRRRTTESEDLPLPDH